MRKIFIGVILLFSLLFLNHTAFSSFLINGDGTVADTYTGLVWQQETAGPFNWEEALTYCETLSLGGYDDWHLPNRNELQSLVDYSLYGPAIDTNVFSDTRTSGYWSSTTNAYDPDYAWYVYFNDGYIFVDDKSDACYVRAVRPSGLIDSLVILVTNLYSGYPVQDADVIIEDTSAIIELLTGTTNPNGQVVFFNLPFGEYTIDISAYKYIPLNDTQNFTYSGTVNLLYEMEPYDFYFKDADQDGYGLDNDSISLTAPDTLNRYTALVAGDCNDNDKTVYPGAVEICDGKDNDCNGTIPPDEVDADLDGFMICEEDCDDTDIYSYPGAPARKQDKDNDCSGFIENDEKMPSPVIGIYSLYPQIPFKYYNWTTIYSLYFPYSVSMSFFPLITLIPSRPTYLSYPAIPYYPNWPYWFNF